MKGVSWHDHFHYYLIMAYLGVYSFDDLITFLNDSTTDQNIPDDQLILRLEFAANYLIILKM